MLFMGLCGCSLCVLHGLVVAPVENPIKAHQTDLKIEFGQTEGGPGSIFQRFSYTVASGLHYISPQKTDVFIFFNVNIDAFDKVCSS